MRRTALRDIMIEAIPGGLLALSGITTWLLARDRGPDPQHAFAGWLCLVTWGGTVAGIVRAAAGRPRGMGMSYAILVALVALLICGVGLSTGFVGVKQLVPLVTLNAAWIACWTAFAAACRRLGPVGSGTLALLFSMLLMASPVALVPAVHATHAAAWIINTIRYGCPFLALFDAVRPMYVDWPHQPGMYAWSGLGNDVALPLPNVWLFALIYALAALVSLGIGLLFNRRAPQPG
jgi:hypothetical protein